MSGIKLVNSGDFIILNKKNGSYVISDTKQWIFLSKFTQAYLLIDFPNGKLETPIDAKYVYNQDFVLSNDLDFNFKYILPIGASLSSEKSHNERNLEIGNLDNPCNKIPFTGSLDGYNYSIKNINLIDCENTGLFGVMRSSKVKNLVIQNVVIQSGQYVGALVAKGFDVEISNIKIIGNIFINGNKSGILAGLLEANCKNIFLCVNGEINSQSKGLISYYFYGSMENINVISKITNCWQQMCPGLFNDINGRIKNIGLISFNTITKPFFQKSNYYQICNCYYFQLNNEPLPQIQDSYNSFYRNLSNEIQISDETELNLIGWIKIGDFYYLKDMINYSNENLETDLIKYYDWSSDKTNFDGYYINKDSKIYHNNQIISEPYSRETLLKYCKLMEFELIQEQNINLKHSMENLQIRKDKLAKLLQIFKEMELLDNPVNQLSDVDSSDTDRSEIANLNTFNRNIRIDAKKLALEEINKLNSDRVNQ